MPLFEYRCPDGHTRTELCRMNENPPRMLCNALIPGMVDATDEWGEDITVEAEVVCGKPAMLCISAVAPPVVKGQRGGREGVVVAPGNTEGFRVIEETPTLIVRQKGESLVLVDWRCAQGHDTSDVLDAAPEPGAMIACPTCGQPAARVLGVPDVGWFEKLGGAYYDQGLGCIVTSREHRRRLMAERGLVEFGEVGDIHEDWARKQAQEARESDEGVRQMLRGMEHGPDAATLKKARDRGEVLPWDWATERLGGLD